MKPQDIAAKEALLTPTGQGAPADAATYHRVTQRLFAEARALDEDRMRDWMDMLSEDVFYWCPLRENRFRKDKRPEIDPAAMSLFEETKDTFELRLGRIESGMAWTEDPPTRHCYNVSNIEVFETATPGEYEVLSVFILYRNRSEHDDSTIQGRRRDVWREEDGTLRLARRLVLLQQSTLLSKNLNVFF